MSESEHEAHQFVGQAKRRATKIGLEAVGLGIFDSFFPDNSRSEVVDHVISGATADRPVWMSL